MSVLEKIVKLLKYKWIQNILAWEVIFIILLGLIDSENKVLTALSVIILLAPPIYINNLVIVPFFRTRKLLQTLLVVFNCVFWGGVFILILLFFSNVEFQWRILSLFGLTGFIVLIGYTLQFVRDHLEERNQARETQLQLLKEQLNPHFLFNTLNNLYGLSIAESKKVPDLMLKLSDMLRYSLYDTEDEFVPLEKETVYLENYIALERIRLEERHRITFLKEGNFSAVSIPPMLLIVFVENAFKHLNKLGEGQVDVSIRVLENQFHFRCTNTYERNDINLKAKNSGIGLKNARQRLKLIYGKAHQLKISQTDEHFLVELTIDVNN